MGSVCQRNDRGTDQGVNKDHIIRATLESLAYQVNDVLEAMGADSGIALSALKVDGGARLIISNADMEAKMVTGAGAQAEVGRQIAMGAAYLAGLAVGYWKDKEDVKQNWDIGQGVPARTLKSKNSRKMLKGWKKLCSTHMDGQKKSYHRKLSVISKTLVNTKKRYIVIVTE